MAGCPLWKVIKVEFFHQKIFRKKELDKGALIAFITLEYLNLKGTDRP
jgi:hypothetical protein